MHQPEVAPAAQLGTREQSNPHVRTPQGTRPGMSLMIATTPEEREAIYRLRYEIYAVENGFRAQGHADYRAWEDVSDVKAVHLCATTNGELVGALRTLYGADAAIPNDLHEAYELARFAAVVPLEKIAVTSRFALKPEHRAGMAALQLFVESARIQRERGVELSFGDAPLNLVSFYCALGFRTYAAPYHHPVAGTLVPFVLPAGDLPHLRQIRSPLLALADDSESALDEKTKSLRELLFAQAPVRGAKSHAARFWEDLHAALGPSPFDKGPLAGLTAAELRSLLGQSYVVDWPGGKTLLQSGHPVTERWLLLSGQVEVNGDPVPPFSVIGGAFPEGGQRHSISARIGTAGARLLSLDERKLKQLLAATSRTSERIRSALQQYQVTPTADCSGENHADR